MRTTAEDTPYVFTLADAALADTALADAALVAQSAGFNPVFLTSLKVINMPADGVLQKQLANQTWVNVALNDNIPLQDIRDGKLRFLPDTNESGFEGYQTAGIGNQKTLYAEFTFQALGMGAGPLSGTSAFGMKVTPVVDMDFYSNTMGFSLVSQMHGGTHRHDLSIATAPQDAEGVDDDGSERTRMSVTYVSGMQIYAWGGPLQTPQFNANGEVWVNPTDHVFISSSLAFSVDCVWYYRSSIDVHVYREELDNQGNVIAFTKTSRTSTATHYYQSPIVLDLDGDGVRTSGLEHGVQFDLNDDGKAGLVSWTAGGDGLLVLDRNGDGQITSGAELFGNHTRLASGELAHDGFEALRELDSNGDGQFSAADTGFAQARVWVDANHDGVSQAPELHTLFDMGVASIDLGAVASDRVENGDLYGLVSSYTRTDGSQAEVVDVWFQTLTEASRHAANTVM